LTAAKDFTGKYLLGALGDECEKFGLDLALVADALNGDDGAIQAIAGLLVRHKHSREWLEKTGQTAVVRRGLGMPDSLINELALRMLEAFAETCEQNDSTLSRWRARPEFRALISSVGTVKNSHVLLRRPPARSFPRKVAKHKAIKR
jgi:hypothetical protein